MQLNSEADHTYNYSLINKQLIIHKYDRNMKIRTSDLQPYMSPQFGFIDPDFTHSHASINYQQEQSHADIAWITAQELHPLCSYSKEITALDQLSFSNKSIEQALMVINWFTKVIFLSIFNQQLSDMHLYQFDLMIDGIFVRIAIDSYIPVDVMTNQPLFAKPYKGSIFPCIVEKMMAKVYGDYYSITGQFVDIVEMLTYFCREEISCTQGIPIQSLIAIIASKLDNQSIVCFRTRNSIRLQSFGLQSNHVYIILKLIHTEDNCLVQFLQMQGSSWIGKYSKLRSNWSADLNKLAASNQVVLEQEQKQNYMSVADLRGIAREVVVLNNTLQYHKNYVTCEKSDACLSMYELRVDSTNILQVRTSFRQKKCYNSMLLIQLQPNNKQQAMPSYRLMGSSFNQNKSSNYLQCQISHGMYWIIVYNTHPQENALPYHLTVYANNTFPELRQSNNQAEVIGVLQATFVDYFIHAYADSKQPVILKHLYQTTGLGFIFINPKQSTVEVSLQLTKLKQSKIHPLNICPSQQDGLFKEQFRQQRVLCFYCQWSRKQNIQFEQQKVQQQLLKKVVFPPMGSIKVRLRRSNIIHTATH